MAFTSRSAARAAAGPPKRRDTFSPSTPVTSIVRSTRAARMSAATWGALTERAGHSPNGGSLGSGFPARMWLRMIPHDQAPEVGSRLARMSRWYAFARCSTVWSPAPSIAAASFASFTILRASPSDSAGQAPRRTRLRRTTPVASSRVSSHRKNTLEMGPPRRTRPLQPRSASSVLRVGVQLESHSLVSSIRFIPATSIDLFVSLVGVRSGCGVRLGCGGREPRAILRDNVRSNDRFKVTGAYGDRARFPRSCSEPMECFGTKGSQVQILSPRLISPCYLRRFCRRWQGLLLGLGFAGGVAGGVWCRRQGLSARVPFGGRGRGRC